MQFRDLSNDLSVSTIRRSSWAAGHVVRLEIEGGVRATCCHEIEGDNNNARHLSELDTLAVDDWELVSEM